MQIVSRKEFKKMFPSIIDEALRLRHRAGCQKILFLTFCVNFCLLGIFNQSNYFQPAASYKDSQAVANCIPLSVQRVNFSLGHLRECENSEFLGC